jgi:hypothetical protein
MEDNTLKQYAEELQSSFNVSNFSFDKKLYSLEIGSAAVPIMNEQAYRLEVVLHTTATFPEIDLWGISVSDGTPKKKRERIYIILSESGSLLASLKKKYEQQFRLSIKSFLGSGTDFDNSLNQRTLDDLPPNYVVLWEVNNNKDLLTGSKRYFLFDQSGSTQRFKELINPIYRKLSRISDEKFTRKEFNKWIDEGESPTIISEIQTYHPVTFILRTTIPFIEWISEQLTSLANIIEYAHIDSAFWKRSNADYQNSIEVGFKRLENRLKVYQNSINRSFEGIRQRIIRFGEDGILDKVTAEILDLFYPDYQSDLTTLVQKLQTTIDRLISLILNKADDLIENLAAFIAFLCGLWDAFVDAFSGVLHFLSFGFLHLRDWIKAIADPESSLDLFTELFDEMIQTLKKFIYSFLKEEEPEEGEEKESLLEAVFNEISAWMILQFEDISHKLGQSGTEAAYYYGYFIYDILESAFPPLKLTRSAAVAQKVEQVLSKVHSNLYGLVQSSVI